MQIGRQPTNHRTWRGAGELAHGIGQAARAEQLAARPMGLGDAIAVEQQPVPGGERLPAGVARPTSPCPNAGPGAGGRRASRGATASPSRSGRSPSACPPTPSRPSPAAPPPPGAIIHSRFAFVRVVAAHAVTDDHRPPRREWLIIEWPEDHDGPTDYWLEPASGHRARAAGAACPAALDDRARLSPAQGRARTRSLQGPQLPRLSTPLRAGHPRARVPDARTDVPKSAAGGRTLPQAVLLLQPLLRCWDGCWRTCRQTVNLHQLVLFPRRE